MGRKVGIFGGSFDPVHLGHVFFCVYFREVHQLDHVYVIPTNTNPHKREVPRDNMHRLEMLKKAFRGVPKVSICTLEIERKPPSYMIDTLHELYSKKLVSKKDALYLLLGQDLLPELHRWKSVHELITLAKVLIAERQGTDHGPWEEDPLLKKWVLQGMKETPHMDMSSSEIRRRIKQGLFCGHLLNKSVLTYIMRHKLYHD